MSTFGMKIINSLMMAMMLLAGCSGGNATPTQPPVPPTEPPTTTEAEGMPPTGEGLCANAYYPVREGATWTYASTGSPAGDYTYTDTITAVREDGFTLTSQFPDDLTRTQEWACTPDGLVALQLGGAAAATLNTEDMNLNLTVKNVSGVTFPAEISAGDAWRHTLEFEGALDIAGTPVEANGTAQSDFKALGVESVTVPAGTFEAMKIEVISTININATFQGIALPVTFAGTYTYWFAEGVGWVKSSGSGEFGGNAFTETGELQSYSIP